MNDAIRRLAQTVDSEAPRSQRARDAAEIVRDAGNFRWVGIYDVADDEIALISESGSTASQEAVRTGLTAVGEPVAAVPILGAESAIAIGILDATGQNAVTREGVALLEEFAAALRPLYD